MLVLHKKDIPNYLNMDPRLTAALSMIADGAVENDSIGKTIDSDLMYHMVQCYDSKPFEQTKWESHKKYIDIQFMVKGEELVGIAPIECEKTETEAIPQNDVWFYECKTEPITLIENSFMVLYPNDLHCPGVATNGKALNCRKVVVKVKV